MSSTKRANRALPSIILSLKCTYSIDISYTRDSASACQKVKPKISAVFPHNNRRRPYWSFPLIKKFQRKHYTFCICVLILFRFIVNFVHFRNTKYTNYHAPCQLCGNDQRLRSGFNFRLPTVWDAPSSVYEISMTYSCILDSYFRFRYLHFIVHSKVHVLLALPLLLHFLLQGT